MMAPTVQWYEVTHELVAFVGLVVSALNIRAAYRAEAFVVAAGINHAAPIVMRDQVENEAFRAFQLFLLLVIGAIAMTTMPRPSSPISLGLFHLFDLTIAGNSVRAWIRRRQALEAVDADDRTKGGRLL